MKFGNNFTNVRLLRAINFGIRLTFFFALHSIVRCVQREINVHREWLSELRILNVFKNYNVGTHNSTSQPVIIKLVSRMCRYSCVYFTSKDFTLSCLTHHEKFSKIAKVGSVMRRNYYEIRLQTSSTRMVSLPSSNLDFCYLFRVCMGFYRTVIFRKMFIFE